jgi:hypothetical protein
MNRLIIFLIFLLLNCKGQNSQPPALRLSNAAIGVFPLSITSVNEGTPIDGSIVLEFSAAVNPQFVSDFVRLAQSGNTVASSLSIDDRSVIIQPTALLQSNANYSIEISPSLKGKSGEPFSGVSIQFKTLTLPLQISSIKIGSNTVALGSPRLVDVPTLFTMSIDFDKAIAPSTANAQNIQITTAANQNIPLTITVNNDRQVLVSANQPLLYLTKYQLTINSQLKGLQDEVLRSVAQIFYTAVDQTPKLPLLQNDEDSDTDNTNDLLSVVQKQTFKYFYDFAHPASGMARERNGSGDLVTLGGSGFGVMSLIVGIERGFITRAQGLNQLNKILTFLETCDRFHGVWPHWVNGNTGRTIPFSANDNGADLVETAFMVQGLITMRQYLNAADANEQLMINRINSLWQAVEWNWFTRGNQNVLYWHWSPDRAWAMNMQINGYNEALIIYTLAAASTTHTISPAVYNNGWARNGAMRNNKLFYNIKLPLGYDFGGPLFFAHYSFLGLNPKNLSDQYANYWEQNVNHTLINRAYCIANPKNFVGYSNQNWGLTASDNQSGYSAHSPTNDLGVISPTAALSSMPYTPTESMDALKFFYYTMGDRLWGEYGFYDAFNITEGWIANSYLAIDQGPIVVMIENHRTELLWDLFMSAPEVQAGLTKLGFSY